PSSTSPATSRPIPRLRSGTRTPSLSAASARSRPNWRTPAAAPTTPASTNWRPSGSASRPPKSTADRGGLFLREIGRSVVRQQVYEARCIPAAAAARLHLGIELVDEGGRWQAGLVALGLGQADVEVLAHPVDGEAEVELVLDHGVRPVVHLPG